MLSSYRVPDSLLDSGSARSIAYRVLVWPLANTYCIPGNFSDVETLANLAINSFSLKLQVTNLVLHCNTSSTLHNEKNEKLAKIKRRNPLIFGKR